MTTLVESTSAPRIRSHADSHAAEEWPSRRQLIAFCSVAIPLAGAGTPLAVFLPSFYAHEFGMSLGTVGFVLLLGRLWDAINDPMIGALSDRTRTRFGRRRPWIAAGAPFLGFAAWFLFFPPEHMSAGALGGLLFVFYLGWTMIQIPFSAWCGELSPRYHERTRIATYHQVVGVTAMLAVLVLPTIADQLRPGDERLRMALMGDFMLLTLVPALILTLFSVAEPPLLRAPEKALPLRKTIGLVLGDRLLLRVLASDFAVVLGQTFRGTLIVFFVTQYMGMPQWASGLFLFQFAFGIFAGPIWLRIGYRLGKHRTAVLGELVQVAINLGLLFVLPGNLGLLLVLTLAQGLAQGSGNLMLRSIVADVADRHRLETGADRTGLFYSVFSLSGKAATAVATGIALPLVAWLGFDPRATNAPEELEALKLVFALGPASAHLISALLLHEFPLDETAHAQIRVALGAREDASLRQPAS
jgi:glycoside/pentoside/hexuronide:cation symporter, GPH family